ncbi:hypothetical protein JCM11491_006414 [Sporobolomyces phaffii]
MPPKPPEKGVQVISSFFKPKPPTASTAEVLILSDSDDDDGSPNKPPPARPMKRVKLEHDRIACDVSPIASSSTSRPLDTATLHPPRPPPPPTHSHKRLQAFAYEPTLEGSVKEQRTLTRAEQQTRDAFIEKLLVGGKPRPAKRSSYLQNEHYMAARQVEDEDDERAGPAAMLSDEDEADEEETDPESEGQADSKRNIRGKDVKGKGKAHVQGEEGSALASRFSRFAHQKPTSTKGDSSAAVKYTPLEQQVLALKKENPGVVLAIEVGYKFKFFQEDAQTASRVLNIACFPQQHMLTASIPTHRIDIHVRRLLNQGHKVGIVRQIETAALKKVSSNKSKPFTRALTNLYTSATFIDELGSTDSLGASSSSSTSTLLCLVEEPIGGASSSTGVGKVRLGLVAVMPSTGEVVWDEFEDGLMRSELETRLLHLQPSELLLQKDLSRPTESMVKHLAGQHNAGSPGFTCRIERIPKRPSSSTAISNVTEFYAETKRQRKRDMKKVPSEIILGGDSDGDDTGTDAPGASQKTEVSRDGSETNSSAVFDLPKLVLVALSSLVTHLSAFNLSSLFLHTSSFASFSSRTTMTLNGNTISNLELLRNSTDYQEHGSLITVLDRCKTTMGKRLLRKWIAKPLVSVDAVNERLDAISEIHSANANLYLAKVRDLVKTLPDLERGLARVHFGRATPNELLRVLEALTKVGTVFSSAGLDDGPSSDYGGLKSRLLVDSMRDLPKVKAIVKALCDQVDERMARDGKKEDLFEREQDWPELEECKRERDRVEKEIHVDELGKARKILKKPTLGFKQVALEEYLLEIKVSEKKLVPADWLRINGTKQFYRYRSPSLQFKIQELEQARERLAAAANAAYLSFLQEVASHYAQFRTVITSLSTLDCLFSLALVALSNNYVKPKIVDEPGTLDIVEGRHPVIEQVSSEPFVPNSIKFGQNGNRQMILTGLNMGGKSSLSKSVALIALMAQIGSFVPCDGCTTSLFDGIYTRMGASDELARSRSTFMVELSETSEILKLATERSLIVLDELGRGTSTNDGEAIAGAVLEWIHKTKRCLTVFVTHYPNLATLAKKYPGSITLGHMSCLETPVSSSSPSDDPSASSSRESDITFLYKLVPGLASASHGLNVARMAGLPDAVLRVAKTKRDELERRVRLRVEQRKRDRVERALQGVVELSTRLRSEQKDVGRPEEERLIALCRNLVVDG